jgi:hypothetical protein
MNNNCLNCGKVLTDKFCSGCGQKADTHRITFKNFIFHDVLHGTFHLDRGILFTAKQALTRPGQAALDYISGKRKPFYNVFYLILITIGLMLFTRHIGDSLNNQSETITESKEYINEASKKMDEIFAQKNKIIIFLFVPFAALNSFILFKRKKLNLSEHAIIAGMILLGVLLISTFSNILFWFKPIHNIGLVISLLVTAFIIIYICFGYFNTFSQDYSKFGINYRIALFYIMLSLEIFILMIVLFGIVTNWKFGSVTISPFG